MLRIYAAPFLKTMKKETRWVFKTDTLQLTERADGYWLYDHKEGMHLSMRAKTEVDACIEAIQYYQIRLAESRAAYKDLNTKVGSFISLFDRDDYED